MRVRVRRKKRTLTKMRARKKMRVQMGMHACMHTCSSSAGDEPAWPFERSSARSELWQVLHSRMHEAEPT